LLVQFNHLAVAANDKPGFDFPSQHNALLVSDDVFDRALARLEADRVPFWAVKQNHTVARTRAVVGQLEAIHRRRSPH
jgi:hypothetical protein